MPYAYKSRDLVAKYRTHDLTAHESVEIINAGDLHAGDCYCNIDHIRSMAEWLSGAPNRYAIISGDVFNMATKGSVSLQLSEPNMPAKDARHLMARILEPVRDRILGVISGNHDDRLARDTGEDSVDALCCQIGVPYFPEGEMFVRIKVGEYKHNHNPIHYNGYVTHGSAGGRLPGSKANGLVAMRNIVHNADWYFNGHGHTPLIIPEIAWRFDESGGIRAQQQMFISCGATINRGGYAVRKAYPPLSQVFPTLTLHGDGYKHMTAQAAT